MLPSILMLVGFAAGGEPQRGPWSPLAGLVAVPGGVVARVGLAGPAAAIAGVPGPHRSAVSGTLAVAGLVAVPGQEEGI